jgi:glycosyltransferase involved in cell wall biosynthesis
LDKPETLSTPASTNKQLRILLIVNLPWDARLGAVRVYMELMERWHAAGHIVEKFSLSEAFPDVRSSGSAFAIRQVMFAYKAEKFVRDNGHRFDIVDAVIGSLAGSKSQLRFAGLLVARSVGLYRLYRRFEPRPDRNRPRGRIAGRILYTLIGWWTKRASDAAVRHADIINVPNKDEAACLRTEIDPNLCILTQPYGLTEQRREALATHATAGAQRLEQKKISFVGMWSPRKGAFDWADIIREVWREVPEARFCFFGTMTQSDRIFADLGLRSSERIELVPEYSSDQLATLLADCAVGLFPSYVEGFGLAVLEQLAAGIPTVAFDVPGPRDIFGSNNGTLAVPAGDTRAMAARAVAILRLTPTEYDALSSKCRVMAERFQWEGIARDTIQSYCTSIDRLRPIVFTQPFGLASAAGGGGGRILRSLLRDAPARCLPVCTAPQRPERKYEHEIHMPTRPYFGRIERTRFLRLPHAVAPLFSRGFRRGLKRLCREAGARAVHAIAHGGIDFHHAYRAARALGIPFVLQVHDDAVYTSGGRVPRRTMSRCLREAWANADARFVVSRELGEEYNRRYGTREFVIVTDGADEVAAAARPAPRTMRIYFMGLFHLEYEANLQALIDAVAQIRDEGIWDLPPSITLRCGHIRPYLHRSFVHVLAFGSEADVQADFSDADSLYLPLPFDDAHRAFVTYSLSTKMVTYLASGIPILYHGPPETAACNLLSQNRAAALITSLEPTEIADTLRRLVNDPASSDIAANALALARKSFRRSQQHERFWSTMLGVLNAAPPGRKANA